MKPNLDNAVAILWRVANTYLTDDLKHLHAGTVAGREVVLFLESVGLVEDHDLTDERGRVVNRQKRLRPL